MLHIMDHERRALLAVAISALLVVGAAHASHAQQAETDSTRDARHDKEAANLAKESQNPVANMVSLPLQYNYYANGGLGTASEMVLNVQPVLPLPIGKNWLVVSRTIVPFVSIPLPDVGGGNGISQLARPQFGGIADIQEQAYFTSTKPSKWTWAVGPVMSFPTATNRLARTGQWGLGPTAVGLTMPGPWVIGLLANNVWRIGGDANGHTLNTLTLQPFINYNLAHAWAISTAPLITSDWSAREGNRWTVPIGAGVSKIAHVGDQPLNFILQYYHNVKHPELGGSNQLRMEVAALWPTAAAKAAEQKAEMAKKKETERKTRQGSSP
ncbi:MAG: neuromedin U [Gemmatimonadetes bacterium]|nr:neuromedin U [Gemmatimonadota bacterium]